VHAIDLLPTLLELIGIDPPASIAGVEQSPLEGVSFARTLDDPQSESAHVTQYYEMLGSRALYHQGWKAVVFHTPPFIAYDGSDTTKPFDEDVWELYHVAQDFSEVDDLALTHPAKLEELKALWWTEAEKYQVLPLNNQPGVFADTRYRRPRYEFRGQVGPLAEAIAPNLKNRSFVIAAELVPPRGVLHRRHRGPRGSRRGYVFFVEDGRLHFTYNFVATQITTVAAEVTLPTEPVTVRVVFTRTGPGGTWSCSTAMSRSAAVTIARTTPLTYGTPGFAIGFQPAGPIHPGLNGRAELSPTVLRRVVVESSERDRS
jgi:hypothetical protein